MNMVTPRKAIIERRDEANTCIHYGLYTAAALTACSGVELLLESLFTEYYISLLRDDRENARVFLADRERWDKENNVNNQWTITNWRRYFEDSDIPSKMRTSFGNEIEVLRPNTLKHINSEWNKCKHEFHIASPKIAISIVEILNNSLNELNFLSGSGNNQHASVAQLNKKWQSHWGNQISDWTAQNQDSSLSDILSRLTPLLNLVVNLANDPRIDFKQKTILLVAAHYVYSAIDLIPDVENNANTLVDDGVVLILTMSWLIKNDLIDCDLINEHWPGKEDATRIIHGLDNHVYDFHHELFPNKPGAIGDNIVWSTIRRISDVGPEALWQNYWKEAY